MIKNKRYIKRYCCINISVEVKEIEIIKETIYTFQLRGSRVSKYYIDRISNIDNICYSFKLSKNEYIDMLINKLQFENKTSIVSKEFLNKRIENILKQKI